MLSIRRSRACLGLSVLFSLLSVGCADRQAIRPPAQPAVAPSISPQASLPLDSVRIPPMYRHLLAVDLATVLRVAEANNLDIQEAKQRVEASRGVYQSGIGEAFPIISPVVQGFGIEGAVASSNGGFGLATFHYVAAAVLVQWLLNPGRVIYDIVASKRRLEAATQQQRATEVDTAYQAASQYYDLVLCQLKISAAQQSLQHAEELLRIERVRLQSGNGLPADELRAESTVSAAQQDLLIGLNAFYKASVTLATTLHLDSTVMLAPQSSPVAQMALVRDDLPIDTLLAIAVRYRPDLEAIRKQWAASQADKGAAIFGQIGPQIEVASTISPPPPARDAADTTFRRERFSLAAGLSLDPTTFGKLKLATANEKIAGIDVERKLDEVRASVVNAQQASLTAAKLVPEAKREVDSTDEALRLAQQNLKTGTGLTIDVLQAQTAVEHAHLHYATAIIQYNQSQLAMLSALGLLDPSVPNGLDAVTRR
jgi:outer membrane protein TolC